MRWRRGKPTDKAIVTFIGRPGAAAAAAVLLRHPEAGLFVSSSYSLPSRLSTMTEKESLRELFVIGMGRKGPVEEIREALEELRAGGIDAHWYSGGYWNLDFREAIEDLCDVHFDDTCDYDLEVVVRELDLRDDPRVELLRRVADMEAKLVGKEADYADLVETGKTRYFQLDDLEAYPWAIRVLAEQDPIPAEMRRLLDMWRSEGPKEGPDGCSASVKKLRRQIRKYGGIRDMSVLILGETGVGKELAARAMHKASPRFKSPFFCVNCATLTEAGLIDSRLFGHQKGAFTGAVTDREGILDAADGGTLFLDEIAELPPDTQAKLLRVLENGTYNRLGSTLERSTDIRLYSATNRDLSRRVADGRFRKDLFYRINALVLKIPPLRERPEDIPPLVSSIRRNLEATHGREFPDLSLKQLDVLKSYDWPGNVRQLRTVLQRVWLLEKHENVAELIEEERDMHSYGGPERTGVAEERARTLPDHLLESEVMRLEELEREYARKALRACGGNKTKTARKLGISVNTLYRKLEEEGE
jgi:DNA-binding NtrC family response regulator